ncbi:MAG: SUMF1/EgtB/PvdO family nonheme iron enzyme [Tepidisphaera sp.]|nr:SUMF1/EgtB/PvdO family nonheme iron enzyme [Tepidisphaera sp.]
MRTLPALVSAAIAWLAAVPALVAQPGPPDYGYTWKTIGDPGNVAATQADFYHLEFPVGRVDYTYRMTQTEVTNTQWLEFVNAYSSVHPDVSRNDFGLTGAFIFDASTEPGRVDWQILPDAENAAATMSWLYAARYVNWLQNGKSMTPAAFESGVYDMSTFHNNGDFTWRGNTTRAAGASFWIPSFDEWTKAMHFDPNRYGPNQPGYWLYENSSDSLPVGGLPGTPGAQTSAYHDAPYLLPVGAYPDQQSPWGLLDGSGGVAEYLDGWHNFAFTRGTFIGSDTAYFTDRLDFIDYISADDQFLTGLRLASAVPAPGTMGVTFLGLAMLVQGPRRRVS